MLDKKNKENIKWSFVPSKSVLLVIDMQNDFVLDGAIMQVPAAKSQLVKIKKLIDTARANGLPIIYTVHETDPQFCPLELAAFPHLINAGMRRGSKGAMVVDDLAPQKGDIVLGKRRFSAFYQTELELILRNLTAANGIKGDIDTVIICGTVTNICCESTARDAFFRDFKVVFGSDICSALNQDAHNATLANMDIFGRVMDCDEILKAF